MMFTIDSGGVATVIGDESWVSGTTVNGVEVVEGGARASAATVNSGGVEVLSNGGAAVGQEEQQRRMEARIDDPLRQWKLSPMDLESYARWYAYSHARDMMLEATDTRDAPWYVVRSDDKKRARLNCISHLLHLIPYEPESRDEVKLPMRSDKGEYDDQSPLRNRTFVPERY